MRKMVVIVLCIEKVRTLSISELARYKYATHWCSSSNGTCTLRYHINYIRGDAQLKHMKILYWDPEQPRSCFASKACWWSQGWWGHIAWMVKRLGSGSFNGSLPLTILIPESFRHDLSIENVTKNVCVIISSPLSWKVSIADQKRIIAQS